MSDFLDMQGAKDLNTDAIHIGAVANSKDPVTGSQIDTHVNRVGGVDYTLQGFWDALGPVKMPWTSVTGGTLTQPNQAFLHPANGNYYSWIGAYPVGGYVVAPGTDPTAVAGCVPRTDVVLRGELADVGGADLVNTSDGQSVQTKINEFKLLKPHQTAAQVAKTFRSGSRPVISCYGDSTMWGAKVGDLLNQDVNNPPARLATALYLVYGGDGFTVNNRAISGTTLRQMLAGTDGSGSTFISKISVGGVDAATKIIYCNHCINDSQLNGDVDQYREDLIYFVNSCRSNNKVPILVTANPNPALLIIDETKSRRLYYYVQTMRDVAKNMGVDIVDQFAFFEASTNYFRIDQIVPDGAHLSTDAYKQAGFNLAIPLVCCRSIGDPGDAAGLENTTYFDNLSVNRQIQYRGARTGGILSADRPASGFEGVNYPVVFTKGQKCVSILGLQWSTAANIDATIDQNSVGAFYMQKQFGDQSSLTWDCESKHYGNFYAGLHIVGLLFNMTTPGIGNGMAFSGVAIPKLYESSQIGAAASADPYTKHVIAAKDIVHINSLISSDGYVFCDRSGSKVVRIWVNSGVLTMDLYKNGAVVQTGTAGSFVISDVFAPMQMRVDPDKVILNYGTLDITINITSPLPNMKGYSAYMQYHVAPTFGV